MSVVDAILDTFERRGNAAYFGEDVSQLEHALQTAALAREDSAPDSLIVAALLHDFGHLIHGSSEDVADNGIDARHEDAGEAWLAWHFGPEVTAPVRLHVAAKRYLCATDATYLEQLSPASLQSLKLQGGPMSRPEVELFENEPQFRDAVRLRRWDDQAKIPGLPVPGLQNYRDLLEREIVSQ